MRYTLAKILETIGRRDKKTVFLTGDLGFGLFEDLEKMLGPRFINAGVAEHNMVTVAAGLAYAGFKPWIYSVAPFVTIKVLEEIRNDIALNNTNVKIVGLGGGYDYAIAGPTHHSLGDVAAMLTLPHMRVYAPGFFEDLDEVVKKIHKEKGPVYLRITKAEESPISVPKYQPVRNILRGKKITMVVLGSMVTHVLLAIGELRKKNAVDLWLVCELPLEFSSSFLASIKKTGKLIIIEEHVQNGGLGQIISELLVRNKIPVTKFMHLFAKGYQSKRYGSRNFYLKESGLDRESIIKIMRKLI